VGGGGGGDVSGGGGGCYEEKDLTRSGEGGGLSRFLIVHLFQKERGYH